MRFLLLLTVAGLPAFGGLLDAVRNDDRALAEQLLRSGAKANERDEDGTTPLAWAAMRSNVDMAGLLLRSGADPNLTNELGVSPLAIAITNGSGELAALLLKHRADPNVSRENGETPLMIAARMGRVDIMKSLLASGASVNAREKRFGQTALMWAAGHSEAVQILVRNGADIRAVTKAWDVKYTNYLPTTVTLGKTGIPWNNDGDYIARKGGLTALHFAVLTYMIGFDNMAARDKAWGTFVASPDWAFRVEQSPPQRDRGAPVRDEQFLLDPRAVLEAERPARPRLVPEGLDPCVAVRVDDPARVPL